MTRRTAAPPAHTRQTFRFVLAGVLCLVAAPVGRAADGPRSAPHPEQTRTVVFPGDVLDDKIHGGMLGQILGNLNGLPHEMKYIREPGNVERYTPALPQGAWTDDDTDIEWVYVVEMEVSGQPFLSRAKQVELWRAHINRAIWCSNDYARHLFDLGVEPPLTGRLALNPWANFNISGSFLAETFALCAPGMPRTGAKLALHYTHVAIDAEPAQSTQFTTAMICTAFFEPDIDKILDAGLAAVDEKSAIREVTADVRAWVKQHPDDWRAARRKVRDKYTRYTGDDMYDKNGVRLNTAATVAALLYGRGDFAETLRTAFNFGWDADNNAATCGTVIGVIKGKRWMGAQGWDIKNVYRNTTRDGMPNDETITRYAERVIAVADRVIEDNGGRLVPDEGNATYHIRLQTPVNVEPLPDPPDRMAELRQQLPPRIEKDLAGSTTDRARAAYLAICLGEAGRLRNERPGDWARAIEELKKTPTARDLFAAPPPDGPKLQEKARAAGLEKPEGPRK